MNSLPRASSSTRAFESVRARRDKNLEIGPHLANILVGPIRNMRLSTDGVCIKLLTVLTSRVLHAKSLCPFGFTTRGGGFAGRDANLSPQQSRRARRTVKGYSIRLVTGDEARRKVAVEYVAKGLASGALKPVIDRTFKFDDMVEVHRYLENSGQFGKIVVTL
jgi:Zinc-binding dehydrogenase